MGDQIQWTKGCRRQEGGRGQRSGRISSRTMSKGQDVHVNWHALFGMHEMVHAGPRICAALLLRRLHALTPSHTDPPARPTARRAHTRQTRNTRSILAPANHSLSLTHTRTARRHGPRHHDANLSHPVLGVCGPLPVPLHLVPTRPAPRARSEAGDAARRLCRNAGVRAVSARSTKVDRHPRSWLQNCRPAGSSQAPLTAGCVCVCVCVRVCVRVGSVCRSCRSVWQTTH